MDCQIGAVFAINGEVVGLECFGYQQTFARFFPKLVQSYALDAPAQVSSESVRRFLKGVRKAPDKPTPLWGREKTYGSRMIRSPGPPWGMKGEFCTSQRSFIRVTRMTVHVCLFSDFLKGK